MKRSRGYYRTQRKRAIKKKVALLYRLGGKDHFEGWTRGAPGRLAKGKIHCSCWMCRRKSYDEISHRDAKRHQSIDQQMVG